MEGIIIQSKLDRAILSKGIKAVLDNVRGVKVAKYAGYALVITCILLYVSVFKLESYAPLQGVFAGFVFIFFSSIMSYFNVRKLEENDRVYEQLQYNFDVAQIHIKGESFEGYLEWDQIIKVVETKSFFLLYQSALGASILPKADFTQEQMEDFRSLVTVLPNLKHNILD